ncbi:hypothetical protein CTI12_AA332440 [Artemisia annua]|uniref:Ubiquitin-like protease family profile domain-containing protein n=1 Tax=Artemisia annua TaxID=35608 RepID=A0A2U1MWM2_ARTAN|nr:hypothetical protein CTI12_AA332440 [Artemisia annua]
MKFQKPDNETLFYSETHTNTIEPTPREMKSSWWISSQEYFEKGYSSSTSSDEPIRKKRKVVNRKVVNRKEVTSEVQREVHTTIHREFHVRKEIHRQTRQEGFGEASISDKILDMARDFGDRIYAIEQHLGIPKKSTGFDNFMQVVNDVKFTHPADLEHKLDRIKFLIEKRLVAIEQIVKPSDISDPKDDTILQPHLDVDSEKTEEEEKTQTKPGSSEKPRSIGKPNSSEKPRSNDKPRSGEKEMKTRSRSRSNEKEEGLMKTRSKTRSNDELKSEGKKCLPHIEKLQNEKTEDVKNGVNECMDIDDDTKGEELLKNGDVTGYVKGEAEPSVDSRILDSTFKTLFESPTETELNVDPYVLDSTVKDLFGSPIYDQSVNEKAVSMDSDLVEQELMAVDTLITKFDFGCTPKQEEHGKNTKFVDGTNDDETISDALVVGDQRADVKAIRVPFARDVKPSKYLVTPYTKQPESTAQKPRVREKKCKKHPIRALRGPDGLEIPPWEEDLERVTGAPKTRVAVPDDILAYLRETDDTHGFCFPWAEDTIHVYHNFWERLLCIRNGRDGWLSSTHIDLWVLYLWHYRPADADWVLAGPFFSSMLLHNRLPCYFANGVTYGTPWFAESVEKVYFPMNPNDDHWVLAELQLPTGVITIYDSLCPPLPFVENRPWWLEMMEKYRSRLPIFLKKAEVMKRKQIDDKNYNITFRFADNAPKQSNVRDCGVWVMINLYRLTHNLPLEVKNPALAALAYRERLTEFFWKYKIKQLVEKD